MQHSHNGGKDEESVSGSSTILVDPLGKEAAISTQHGRSLSHDVVFDLKQTDYITNTLICEGDINELHEQLFHQDSSPIWYHR